MNKIFHIGATFKASSEEDDLYIEGMASTVDKDRAGDVVEATAWTKSGGLNNFLSNPVILFNHNPNEPIGKAVLVETNDKGLKLKAKISKSAGKVAELIKDGVLGAFSVGFMVKDADYDSKTGIYVIKEAELLETSVVSVPCNQAATFSIAKSFDSRKEYEEFKETFKSDSEESADFKKVKAQENSIMNEEELQKLIAETVEKTATATAMKESERRAAEQEKAKKAAEEAEKQKAAEKARVAIAVESGTEQLAKDFEAKLAEKDADYEKVINEFKQQLEEKSEELEKFMNSKRHFGDRKSADTMTKEEAVDAYLLGVITRKGLDTKFGRSIMDKAVNTNTGVAVPSESVEAYETFVSTQLESDIQLDLVLDPLFRKIQMNAASMVIPIMPDSGYAEFVTGAGKGTGSAYHGNLEERGDTAGSPFSGVDLSTKILTTKKLTSHSYIANEVEEDAIMPVLPLIREAIIRSHVRAVEQSILMGGHSGALLSGSYDGLVERARDASKTLTASAVSPDTLDLTTTAANKLLELRTNMAKYGRRPSDVIYIVSLDCYYALLEDPDFQNINEVGDLATKISGEVGRLWGSSVLVCDEFPTAADGAAFAIAVNPRNFVVPVQRGVTVEQDYEVSNQRRLLVATQRRGFDCLIGTGGGGQVVAYTY